MLPAAVGGLSAPLKVAHHSLHRHVCLVVPVQLQVVSLQAQVAAHILRQLLSVCLQVAGGQQTSSSWALHRQALSWAFLRSAKKIPWLLN